MSELKKKLSLTKLEQLIQQQKSQEQTDRSLASIGIYRINAKMRVQAKDKFLVNFKYPNSFVQQQNVNTANKTIPINEYHTLNDSKILKLRSQTQRIPMSSERSAVSRQFRTINIPIADSPCDLPNTSYQQKRQGASQRRLLRGKNGLRTFADSQEDQKILQYMTQNNERKSSQKKRMTESQPTSKFYWRINKNLKYHLAYFDKHERQISPKKIIRKKHFQLNDIWDEEYLNL